MISNHPYHHHLHHCDSNKTSQNCVPEGVFINFTTRWQVAIRLHTCGKISMCALQSLWVIWERLGGETYKK